MDTGMFVWFVVTGFAALFVLVGMLGVALG